ncbi:MAG: NAD(P)H-hydrate epimerase, partial [Flavisolibacter sp.]
MTLLSAQQVRDWDQFTIANEPIASVDLMERAAQRCIDWIESRRWQKRPFRIFCGKGNNGGDGLAIARLLFELDYKVSVYILEFGWPGSHDFQTNLQRLHDLTFTDIHFLQTGESLPGIGSNDIVVDALFGSGLNKPLEGLSGQIVDHMNASKATVIS